MVRYSLPCRRHLAQVCLTGQRIPKSVVHPRWWIFGPINTQSNWVPTYHNQDSSLPPLQNPYLEPQRLSITNTGLQIVNAAENLIGHGRAQYEEEVLRTQRGLLRLAEDISEQADIAIRMPDKVKKAG